MKKPIRSKLVNLSFKKSQAMKAEVDGIKKKIETVLDFSLEGGFEGAVEKCIGVGACRKLNAGAMCPSYMATREEVHSTRGRANALRGVLSGSLNEDFMTDKKMLEVLDLCIECKSCKSECPANVDMAKIKYEFLNLSLIHI